MRYLQNLNDVTLLACQLSPVLSNHDLFSGDLCAAKFVDDQWYRAKVEKVTSNDVSVFYMDYGNRATIAKTRVGTLPGTFTGVSPFAKLYQLALVKLAPDVSRPKICPRSLLPFYESIK